MGHIRYMYWMEDLLGAVSSKEKVVSPVSQKYTPTVESLVRTFTDLGTTVPYLFTLLTLDNGT
jgi:hypothetical protein